MEFMLTVKICALCVMLAGSIEPAQQPSGARSRFDVFRIPAAWQQRFWESTEAQHLLALEPRALADLVPVQAGLRWVRCPACGAPEDDEPLRWSPLKPQVVTCNRCKAELPNDQYPAKVPPAPGQPPAIPEDVIEIAHGVVHRYPFHTVPAEKQRYPDERVYITARRDYAAREYLLKAAMYAAMRAHDAERDPRFARLAAVILLRYAQVYPAYATHTDQPRRPPVFQGPQPRSPFRLGYLTAKGDWLGCLDVPIPLVLAYDLIRDDPSIDEAGRLLGESQPRVLVEQNLFHATARYTTLHPDDNSEASLLATRGLFFAARVLDDRELLALAEQRLGQFLERGFYYDGLWNDPDAAAQRRVQQILESWILPLTDQPAANKTARPRPPIINLAHQAIVNLPAIPGPPEIELAAWPSSVPETYRAESRLYGGAGLVRLVIGGDSHRMQVELDGRAEGRNGVPRRLALRLFLDGAPVITELDDRIDDARRERVSAAANTVIVNGLNQRATSDPASATAPGADVLFFASDPDFQVACLVDRWAYPRTTTNYRTTLVALQDRLGPYLIGVFEVAGGAEHAQFFHAAPTFEAAWQALFDTAPNSERVLSASTAPGGPTQPARQGLVLQELEPIEQRRSTQLDQPAQLQLANAQGRGLRLHVLGDMPATVSTGVWNNSAQGSHSVLVTRRFAMERRDLTTRFVTLIEPSFGHEGPRRRVGRVDSEPGVTVIAVHDGTVTNHLIVNSAAGTPRIVALSDGRAVTTDGLAALVGDNALTLAGGSFASCGAMRVDRDGATGLLVAQGRDNRGGWFEIESACPATSWEPGRVLVVRHADGTRRGWTIAASAQQDTKRVRVFVREEPGFRVEPATGDAVYYQYPLTRHPGPHRVRVCTIGRTSTARPGAAKTHEPLGNAGR